MCFLTRNINSNHFKAAKKIERSKESCIPVWALLDPCSVRKPSLTDLLDQLSCPNTERISEQILVHLTV